MIFLEIFSFEIKYQLRRPAVWLYFISVIALLVLLVKEIADDAQDAEEVLLNAPITVAEITVYAGRLGLFLIAVLTGDSVMRDIQTRMYPLVYTTGLRKSTYLAARFLGVLCIASVLLLLAVPLTVFIANLILDIEPAAVGTFRPEAYLRAGILFNLPNSFIATALLYAMVLIGRNAMAGYTGALLIFIFSTFNMDVLGENWSLGKLLDPLGMSFLNALSSSLPPIVRNTAEVKPDGYLLGNRLLWFGIAILTGAVAYWRFQFSHYTRRRLWNRRTEIEAPDTQQSVSMGNLKVVKTFGRRAQIYQTLVLALRYYIGIIKSPAILAIPALAIYTFILIPNLAEGPMGVPILPVTERVVFFLDHSALRIFVSLLIVIFAGQLIWRERDTRLNDIYDTLPVANSVMLISKYISLTLVLITLHVVLMLTGIFIQMAGGYYQPDIWLYLKAVFGFQLLDYLLFSAVIIVIHITVNQKYISHLVAILFYFFTLLSVRSGIEHKLLIFGSDPGLANSLFYDQTAFILPWAFCKLYWIGWSLLLFVITEQLWVRGRDNSFKARFKKIRHFILCRLLLRKGYNYAVLVASSVLIILAGAFVFYNTNILNEYHTRKDITRQQADHELLYSQFKNILQPELTSVNLHIEFYPENRQALLKGTYQLKNKSTEMIRTIHIEGGANVETTGINFDRKSSVILTDKDLRYYVYSLRQPLAPGDSLQMNYVVQFKPQGFSNDGILTSVMNDGSWFSNSEWLPLIGYQTDRELSNPSMRAKYGLPKRPVWQPLTDQAAVTDRRGRERIYFEATIGTSAEQVAVAPGLLKKTWSSNGRKYFQYAGDNPIANAYHIYTAGYGQRQAQWNNVDIQIFHHPRNILNLEGIESAAIASLDYYTKNFGPYPYKQLTLVEYPDPGTGGISLPGTIGYSTNLGLLDANANGRGFNLPFAVIAHEVAHQWWGAQLTPARVEGGSFLSESLAWYSALGVVEQEKGPIHLRNLLNAMRNDYLKPQSRVGLPLLKATEPFQVYRKGPLAMYALREYIGEDKVNLALYKLINKFKSYEPPLATSLDFYKEIRSVTPDSLHYLLRDLFEKNTFWELETKRAIVKQVGKHQWVVTLEILARKIEANADGLETEIPMNDLIEIGILGKQANPNTLYLKKHSIHSGLNRVVISVSAKPDEAGIDPRHLLIDTDMNNNMRHAELF